MQINAIEPMVGHIKTVSRLGRNTLQGALGDAMHAVLCGAGHNVRLLLKQPRPLFSFIVCAITGDRPTNHGAQQLPVG
jgi:IS5 family transposase